MASKFRQFVDNAGQKTKRFGARFKEGAETRVREIQSSRREERDHQRNVARTRTQARRERELQEARRAPKKKAPTKKRSGGSSSGFGGLDLSSDGWGKGGF